MTLPRLFPQAITKYQVLSKECFKNGMMDNVYSIYYVYICVCVLYILCVHRYMCTCVVLTSEFFFKSQPRSKNIFWFITQYTGILYKLLKQTFHETIVNAKLLWSFLFPFKNPIVAH